MKFVLNDYHRNVSDEDLIRDVQAVAERLKKDTLTESEYLSCGKYHSSTLRHRFGSWKKVLEVSSLGTNGHHFKVDISDADVIDDLKRVASIVHSETLTREEYNLHGRWHCDTLTRRYNGSWNKILTLAGMKLNENRNFSNEEMFKEIERIWVMLGRQPTSTDIKNGISKFSLQSYARRFGGWRGTLETFVGFINSEDSFEEKGNTDGTDKNIVTSVISGGIVRHKTSRDINLRLRFKVFARDHFRCCACGASPASTPGVELHIDHIVPWSKGGETTLENLQTLCSKCNLGKSDN